MTPKMNQNLVITHSPDMLQAEDAIAIYRDVQDGFIYNTPDIALEPEQFQQFIADVEAEVCPLKHYDYSKTKNSIYEKYAGDKVRLYKSGSSKETYSSVSAISEEVAIQVWKIFLRYSEDDERVKLYMQSFFMNNGVLDVSSKEIKPSELSSIDPLYYPYIDTNIMFDQFFTGAENIMLLVGQPGLGKSKMATLALRHAVDSPHIMPYDKIKENPGNAIQFVNSVYVKSTEVLVNDKFWRELAKQQVDFCIIDDLDYMLTKREAEVQGTDELNKNAFLNQFLSFTDGVEKHKTKFIITTNQDYDDIDSALLRKGRLFDILELRELTNQEARDIWTENKLKDEEFSELFSTDTVLPAELGSEINKRLNTRIDTATESYLKEENISKVKSAGRAKKISL